MKSQAIKAKQRLLEISLFLAFVTSYVCQCQKGVEWNSGDEFAMSMREEHCQRFSSFSKGWCSSRPRIQIIRWFCQNRHSFGFSSSDEGISIRIKMSVQAIIGASARTLLKCVHQLVMPIHCQGRHWGRFHSHVWTRLAFVNFIKVVILFQLILKRIIQWTSF